MQEAHPTLCSEKIEAVRAHYTTEVASEILGIRPNTMRAALCRDGAYYGVRPVKRPNRLLAWPAVEIDALARGEVVK